MAFIKTSQLMEALNYSGGGGGVFMSDGYGTISCTLSPTLTNLTVSGTSTLVGNVTVGNGGAANAGSITLNNSNALLTISETAAGNFGIMSGGSAGTNITFGSTAAGTLTFITNNSTALTLNTSQNAIFAGAITTTGITMGSGTGTVNATSGVFSVVSDMRAKNHIGIFTTGLTSILKLNPVLYDFKNDIKHLIRAGFYTQEVENYIPEAVFHDSKDGMASLDDRPIIAALVNSIKELHKRIEELESNK